MKSDFIQPLKTINAQQAALFKQLETLSPEILNQKPSETEWSVLETVEHLYTIEMASLKYIQKKLQFLESLPSKKLESSLRYAIMKLFFVLPLKLKAPQFKFKIDIKSLGDAQNQWNALRLELEKTLETLPHSIENGLLWKHTLLGKMTVYHMLLFYKEHTERHKKQINRILKTLEVNLPLR